MNYNIFEHALQTHFITDDGITMYSVNTADRLQARAPAEEYRLGTQWDLTTKVFVGMTVINDDDI